MTVIGHRFADQPVGGGPVWGLTHAGANVRVEMVRAPISRQCVPMRRGDRRGWLKVTERDRNGHPVTYRTLRTELDRGDPRLAQLARAIGDRRAVLLKGEQFGPEAVEWLGSRVDLTFVLFDVSGPGHVARARGCARAIVTGAEAAEAMRSAGVPTARELQGFRPEIWRPGATADCGEVRQIAHTGHLRLGRAAEWAELALVGAPMSHCERTYLTDAARLYWRSAVTWCPPAPEGRDSYSNRLVRVLASGGLPLHAWSPSVARDFPEVATYRTRAELRERARELLALSPAERARRIEAGRAAVARFRWDLVAQRWLDFMGARAPRG